MNCKVFVCQSFGYTYSDVTARAIAGKVTNLPGAFNDYAIFSEGGTTPLYVAKAGQSDSAGAIHATAANSVNTRRR